MDYKYVYDHMNGIESNIEYWDLTPMEKTSLNLSKSFNKHVYEMIHVFMSSCLTFNPPHLQDTMALDDHIFTPLPTYDGR